MLIFKDLAAKYHLLFQSVVTAVIATVQACVCPFPRKALGADFIKQLANLGCVRCFLNVHVFGC